jgi:hypothetical protein
LEQLAAGPFGADSVVALHRDEYVVVIVQNHRVANPAGGQVDARGRGGWRGLAGGSALLAGRLALGYMRSV